MQILGWLWCGRWLWLPHLGLGFHGLLEDGVELLFIQGKALEGAARGLHRLGNEGFWDFEFHYSNFSRGWDFIFRSLSISTCSDFLAFSTRSFALAIASVLR